MTGTAIALDHRIDALDWQELEDQLDRVGHAITPVILNPVECAELADLFDSGAFRSTVEMARHRFGEGRYRYFDRPLPEPIDSMRRAFYPHLATVANRWSELLRGDRPTFPLDHDQLIARCRAAGQTRPTPLILRYRAGEWNALHQDLYGEVYFPFQVLVSLSQRGEDYEGGEFVLLEQRPRAQSRAHVLTPPQGACIIFPTAERPNKGANGYHRIAMRQGVSTVTCGQRTALGIIFHDAK